MTGIARLVAGAASDGAARVVFHTKDTLAAAVGGGAWGRRLWGCIRERIARILTAMLSSNTFPSPTQASRAPTLSATL